MRAQTRYRYCIRGVQIKLTEKMKHKIRAQLLVDGEIVHDFLFIKKGEHLAWDEPLYCPARSNSIINFKFYEENYFGLKVVPKGGIEFTVSEISGDSIEREHEAYSVSVRFLNPPTVLHPQTICAAFKTILEFGTAASKLCPTVANMARTSCQNAYETLRQKTGYARDIEELAVGFADILGSNNMVNQSADSIDLKKTTTAILEQIQEATRFITNHVSITGEERREITCWDRVQDLLKQLRQLKKDFDQQLAEQAYLDRMNEALSKLKPATHSTHLSNGECLPGTRITVIGDVNEWIERKAETDRLMWIHGPSGIGKSSIAGSVCRLLEARNMLCTSFFCKWDDPELREPESVLDSIVYGLARRVDPRKLAACSSHEDPDSFILSLRTYEHLAGMPLVRMVDQEATPESTCIVVDALDQCGTKQTRTGILSYLFNLSQLFPWLKIIVAACPEQDILEFFDSISESFLKKIDLCKYDASKDISAFILERMSSERSGSLGLDSPHVSSLTDSAGGLFVWADIACRFLLEGPDPRRCLNKVLTNEAVTDTSLQLDLLYAMVLKDTALNLNRDRASKRWLGTIIATGFHTPLSVDSLKQLLGKSLHPDALSTLLKALRPILYEDSNCRHGVIRVYHRSFVDYITTQSRSKGFYVDLAKQYAVLSTCCLGAMLGELKLNICGLETSYMLNCEVPNLKSRVRAAIGPHLRYSCLWWIDHLVMSDLASVDMALLRRFLFGRVLFYWIEALSLMNILDIAAIRLSTLVVWAHAQKDPNLFELSECVRDAYGFITHFHSVISESTPHLYLSALAFAPTHSAIARRGREWFPNIPELVEGAAQSWSPLLQILSHPSPVLCLAVSPDCRTIVTGSRDNTIQIRSVQSSTRILTPLIGHSDSVWSVAFSSDSRYVASGSQDNTVRVWDIHSGAGSKVLEGHSGPVLSIAFSRDGRCIASGSHDKTVRMWDTGTCAEISPRLVGHAGPVLAVAFSPDDSCIASGSFDKTVRTWDTVTGVSSPFIGHSGWIRSVAFSPDGQRIVSGSSDKTIRIWELKLSGKASVQLSGHSGMVNCVAFSPDGLRIISGSSDNTVRIWDAETGGELFAPLVGHLDHVTSVGFFSDNWRIVSGSRDHTMRIWDSQRVSRTGLRELSVKNPGWGRSSLIDRITSRSLSLLPSPESDHVVSGSDNMAAQTWVPEPSTKIDAPFIDHSDWVLSVAFSPDGRRIVSGSKEKIVRIWDAETHAQVFGPLTGHSGSVSSVAFSPDGRRIVSGSSDKTVRMWDAHTHTQAFKPLTGHSGSVSSVAFSPNGRRIVSGSSDKTVRIWDTETCAQVFKPLTGHSGSVSSVAFSPDGRRIVSGSSDKTVRIWDADTCAQVFGPLTGHSDSVSSVAFSPDGRRIVSGSSDQTVRIWDAETCAQVFGPLTGHSGSVSSVAFSPDGRRIVSGSSDKTVRIWDAETRTQVFGSFTSHSNEVISVAYSPNGGCIASSDSTIRIWDVDYYCVASGYPFNISFLFRSMQSTGWVSTKGKPLLLWIPSEFRSLEDNVLLSTSNPPIPPRILIDFSKFVHGTKWASQHAGKYAGDLHNNIFGYIDDVWSLIIASIWGLSLIVLAAQLFWLWDLLLPLFTWWCDSVGKLLA